MCRCITKGPTAYPRAEMSMQETPAQPCKPVIDPNPSSATTPTNPSVNPSDRRAPNRSCTPKDRDSNTTHMGTVAMRMPVTEEPIHCSPIDIAAKGITNSANANATSAPVCPVSEASAPRRQAIGTRMSAASVTRLQAIISGGTSVTATLMRK